MLFFDKFLKMSICFFCLVWTATVFGDNQTPTVDEPAYPGKNFPFKIGIELTDFELPHGLQSYVVGLYDGKWLLLAGRTNGLHAFADNDDNFPPQKQNKNVYVVDPMLGTVHTRSLESDHAGLKDWQVDLLSVTSPQFLQIDDKLYITGGYGVDSATGEFSTKPYLTAIDMPGLIDWVLHENSHDKASKHIRHLFNPIFQVTGGSMKQIGNHPILLIVGQNFKGFYTSDSNGEYTQQIRRFDIIDDGCKLDVKIHPSKPSGQDPNLRRRDLNVVRILRNIKGRLVEEIDILSGVFTDTGGIWTVPVRVDGNGNYFMPDPENSKTFKQGMNNYASATFGLYSTKKDDMYIVLLGGISFGFFQNGKFQTDAEIPFINQVTTINIDKKNKYKQFIMDAEYPTILATRANPGNPLLFGAGAQFIVSDNVALLTHNIIDFEALESAGTNHIPIGYIVGGIASSVPNTTSRFDTKASPYIFRVFVDLKSK